MTAGQALDWMIAHPDEELIDSLGDRWRYREFSTEVKHPGDTWEPASIASFVLNRRWSIPERKLPELPEGAEYVLNDKAPYVRCSNGYHFYFVTSPEVAKVYRVLAEEFETRPK